MQINTQPGIQTNKVSRKRQNSKSSADPGFELTIKSNSERDQKRHKQKDQKKADPDHHIDVKA